MKKILALVMLVSGVCVMIWLAMLQRHVAHPLPAAVVPTALVDDAGAPVPTASVQNPEPEPFTLPSVTVTPHASHRTIKKEQLVDEQPKQWVCVPRDDGIKNCEWR